MRTEEWFDTRQERAERRLREALATGDRDLRVIFDAFDEITRDPVAEPAVRILARALGVLPLDAFLFLLGEASNALRGLGEEAVHQTKERVNEALELRPHRGSVTVASIRSVSPYSSG